MQSNELLVKVDDFASYNLIFMVNGQNVSYLLFHLILSLANWCSILCLDSGTITCTNKPILAITVLPNHH